MTATHVAALGGQLEGLRLVAVERLDAAGAERVGQAGIDGVGDRHQVGGPRRKPPDGGDGVPRLDDEAIEQLGEVRAPVLPRHVAAMVGGTRRRCQRLMSGRARARFPLQ